VLAVADITVPLQDGIPPTPPEGYVTLYPTLTGLKLVGADGAVADIGGAGAQYGAIVGVGRNTDLLLLEILEELRRVNRHLSALNEAEL
jgi:hypothetical protein